MPEAVTLTLSPVLERALLYVAVAVSTFVAFTNWRRGDARAFREPLIAFFALWFIQGALLAAAANPDLLPASIVQGLDFASVVLLGWGFLASSTSRRFSGALLGSGLTLAAALIVFSISAARMAGAAPAWIGAVWSFGSLLVSSGTVVILVLGRSPDRTSGLIAAFSALALSAALDALALSELESVCLLIGYWLFPAGLYQRALSDLRSVHDTLREFSQSALKQTQELVTLLEASTYLFTSFDLDELLRKVVEHAAIGIDADRAVIVLADEAAPQTMRLASSFPRAAVETGHTFLLNMQPALALAVSSGETLQIGPRGHGASQLTQLLNMQRPGRAVVQPLSTQENTIGIFVAANERGGRDFSEGQIRLLEALGAQIAAAIVNATLYRSLDTQARELARVLATREQEVGWHTSVLESIGDGVIVTDQTDQVIVANSVVTKLLDTPMEYLLHHPLGNIFERLTPLGGAQDFAPRTVSPGTDMVRAAFEFGERALHVSMTPVHSLGGDRLGLVVVLRDITAERRSQESRSEFVGSIAREFRTPLTTIKGYADLLAKGAAGSLPAAASGFVETVRANAERLSAQVNAILQFNELDRGRIELNIEEADVASILSEAANAYRPQLEARGLSLDVQVKPNLPSVRADRSRVRLVLDQLVDNALKFTPDGGRVRLTAAPSWDGLSTERPAYVAVSVADTGIGFEPADYQRVFEAFYRGEERLQADQPGLGIGLTIARGLCEAMGGQLWGHSQKDRGATFTLVLPVARVTDSRLADAETDETTLESWIERALSRLDDSEDRER